MIYLLQRYDYNNESIDIDILLISHNSESKADYDLLYSHCSGGYRVGVTPGPISNPEAKPYIADNTADFICGNVGRCQA